MPDDMAEKQPSPSVEKVKEFWWKVIGIATIAFGALTVIKVLAS